MVYTGGMKTGSFTEWVGELARTHTRQLAGVARAEGLSAIDALDAVQEGLHTFLLLPQARTLVDDVEDSAKLLGVVVRNVARNMRRRHHRSQPHDDVANSGLANPVASVDEVIARAEDHVRLLGCMSRLAEVQKHVVTLRMLEEMSGEEVGRELGLTPSHVAVLLHRAKKELERCMLAYE